jgi:hypothetical protein
MLARKSCRAASWLQALDTIQNRILRGNVDDHAPYKHKLTFDDGYDGLGPILELSLMFR